MDAKQFRESIYNSLEQGDVDEAVTGLVHYLRDSDFFKQYNSALLFKSKWETIKREQLNGTISRPEYELALSKIITGVQTLVGEIVPNKRAATVASAPAPPSSVRSITWIIVVIAVIVVGGLFFRSLTSAIVKGNNPGMHPADGVAAEAVKLMRDSNPETIKPAVNATPETLEPAEFDLPNGSQVAYKAMFSTWPTNENEHGSAKPSQSWNGYEIEALSNTWVGPGRSIMLDNSFNNDFIYDMYFKVLQGTPSLEVTLSDDGQNYSTIDLYLQLEDYSFTIEEGFLKDNFYKSTAKTFTKDRERMDSRIVAQINLKNINKISFLRVGNTVKFYFNNFLIKSFEPFHINFKKISIGTAFKSTLQITSIEVKASK